MENRYQHPLERLRRDLAALAEPTKQRPTADERLAAELGHDLLAAILDELGRGDVADVPLGRRRRAA